MPEKEDFVLISEIEGIKNKVDEIHNCLYVGNSKPGLITRIKLLEVAVAKQGKNWSSLFETLIRDILVVLMMYYLLK